MSSESLEVEVPGPGSLNLGSWAESDSKAKAEEKNWSSLDKVREDNDKYWLHFYGWLVIVIAGVFSVIFLCGLAAWSLHYMLPEQYLWLKPEQLSKIQSVLFSGGMGAVISSLIKRQMDRLDASKG